MIKSQEAQESKQKIDAIYAQKKKGKNKNKVYDAKSGKFVNDPEDAEFEAELDKALEEIEKEKNFKSRKTILIDDKKQIDNLILKGRMDEPFIFNQKENLHYFYEINEILSIYHKDTKFLKLCEELKQIHNFKNMEEIELTIDEYFRRDMKHQNDKTWVEDFKIKYAKVLKSVYKKYFDFEHYHAKYYNEIDKKNTPTFQRNTRRDSNSSSSRSGDYKKHEYYHKNINRQNNYHSKKSYKDNDYNSNYNYYQDKGRSRYRNDADEFEYKRRKEKEEYDIKNRGNYYNGQREFKEYKDHNNQNDYYSHNRYSNRDKYEDSYRNGDKYREVNHDKKYKDFYRDNNRDCRDNYKDNQRNDFSYNDHNNYNRDLFENRGYKESHCVQENEGYANTKRKRSNSNDCIQSQSLKKDYKSNKKICTENKDKLIINLMDNNE